MSDNLLNLSKTNWAIFTNRKLQHLNKWSETLKASTQSALFCLICAKKIRQTLITLWLHVLTFKQAPDAQYSIRLTSYDSSDVHSQVQFLFF